MKKESASNPRISLITGCLNLGGSTTFLLNLCGELVQREISHQVVCLQPEHPLKTDFDAAGINVKIVDDWPRIFEDQIAWGVAQVREFQPTHAIGCLAPRSFEVVRHLPDAIRRFGMVQSDDPGVYRALQPYSGHFDAVIGVSRRACEVINQTPGLDRLPACYQPYGIPVPETVRRGVPAPDSPLRIIYLGRLHKEQKRVGLFPDILKTLCASDRPFVWTLAGEGPERQFLETSMQTGNPRQRVLFTGQVAYSQVPDLLRKQDVFLLASDYEGLPLSLLEAMAHGVVPVVSDLSSGIQDVVTDNCGMRVPVHDTAGYARAILALDADRERLAAMALAVCEKIAGEFSTAAMAERWLKMLGQFPGRSDIRWLGRIDIHPLQACERPLYFHPLLRPLRRLAVHLKKIGS